MTLPKLNDTIAIDSVKAMLLVIDHHNHGFICYHLACKRITSVSVSCPSYIELFPLFASLPLVQDKNIKEIQNLLDTHHLLNT